MRWILVTAFSPRATEFLFCLLWFPPWHKSCLIPPPPSSRWHVAARASSGAGAQAPWESDRLLSTAEEQENTCKLIKSWFLTWAWIKWKLILTCNSCSQIRKKYLDIQTGLGLHYTMWTALIEWLAARVTSCAFRWSSKTFPLYFFCFFALCFLKKNEQSRQNIEACTMDATKLNKSI